MKTFLSLRFYTHKIIEGKKKEEERKKTIHAPRSLLQRRAPINLTHADLCVHRNGIRFSCARTLLFTAPFRASSPAASDMRNNRRKFYKVG